MYQRLADSAAQDGKHRRNEAEAVILNRYVKRRLVLYTSNSDAQYGAVTADTMLKGVLHEWLHEKARKSASQRVRIDLIGHTELTDVPQILDCTVILQNIKLLLQRDQFVFRFQCAAQNLGQRGNSDAECFNANLYTVQNYATDWGALFAGLTIAMIPTLILFLFGEKYTIKGMSIGGLKG